MGDFELLRAYVEPGTEAAFTELVNRHINLVHSAALRQVADPQTAAEISQTVFIILARKARTIQPGTVLAGWLLLTTRYTAANARRRDQHRHVTEQQAMDHLYMSYTDAAWKQIAPLLDEALVALRESDRDAVALRFFEERSFKEIGAALSISEDSARKRVSRALKRLRSLLARRGCVVPVAVVTLAISGRVAKAAPAALGETVAAAVLKETVTVASLPFLVQATLQTLNWIRWRSIAFRTATVAFTVGLAVFLSGIVSTKGGAQPNRTQVHAQLSVPQPATANPAASEEGAALAQVPPQPNGPGLLFRVVDAESQSPLEKVRLTLTWITEFPDRRTNTYATDGNGECVFPIDRTPVKNWNSRIEVFKDGYVPKFVSWSASQGDTIDAIPAQYTARLTRGTEIGGLVVNEEGDPVPDVRVVFNVSGPSPGASHDRERLTMMGNYHAEVTDVQGRWRCDHVPQQFGMITFECFHPLYLTARFGATALGATTALGMNYVAEAELRNGTARTTLKTGPLVAGTVVDEAGKPIPHAKVTENRAWHEASASEETGSGGRFRFANNSQQDLVLTVQAKAFAPLDLTIHPGEQTGALTLALSKGGLLRGKIVDGFGQPVPDAKIRVGNAKSGDRRFEWSARSDAQGTFEWASAPHQTSYEVEASGYQSQSNVELTPDGSEHAITLLSAQQGKTFHISGTAVDSETGKPIETFHVLTVTTEGERTPSGTKATSISSPELQVIGTAGKFSFDGHRSILHYIV
ncbi:MAG TPA: sigma-70 family RNA polymerase sigma factor, partial [Verrucomicrobiae bacterium]|nr:sigma-70 family RNA polymerase sigma factor [Verrucomicrobiae bacterium]